MVAGLAEPRGTGLEPGQGSDLKSGHADRGLAGDLFRLWTACVEQRMRPACGAAFMCGSVLLFKGKGAAHYVAKRSIQQKASVKGSAALNKGTPDNKAKFLERLAQGDSVSKAAAAVGATRRTAYDWRDADEEFRKMWDDAMEAGIDALEDEARRRAVDGVSRPILYKGDPTGHEIVEYSDTMLALLLKGKRANIFNTERHEHSGPQGGAIDHRVTVEFVSVKKGKDK